MNQTKKCFIKSGPDNIYVEIGYPDKLPAPAVILPHGLRSYYAGFLNNFSKRLRDVGYISVKFHFVGTGKSSGKFEDKTSKAMLQNYKDVLEFIKNEKNVTDIGIVGRSNAGGIAVASGPDPRVKAYALLSVPRYYVISLKSYINGGSIKGKFLYNPSFKRPHTKGLGRMPVDFIDESALLEDLMEKNIGKIKNAIYMSSDSDEVLKKEQKHFEFFEKYLPEPRKIIQLKGLKHSFQGKQKQVIQDTIQWFNQYLPVK